MLTIVSGKQRGGKSQYLVREMRNYFVQTKMNILTNFPIQEGEFKKHLLDKYNIKEEEFDDRFIRLEGDEAMNFLEYKKPNTVLFFDEAYELFPSKVPAGSPLKKDNLAEKIMYYSRQHAHFHDDIFIISHNFNDLNVMIKRGAQKIIYVSNSVDTNMFKVKVLQGLKWPVQFFIIKEYSSYEDFVKKIEADSDIQKTDPVVFSLYDSFNVSAKLKELSASGKNAKSSDNKSYWLVILKWLESKGLMLIILIVLITIVVSLFRNFIPDASKKKQKIALVKKKNNLAKKKLSKKTETVKEKIVLGEIKYRSSKSIRFDNYTLINNQKYNNKVLKIKGSYLCLGTKSYSYAQLPSLSAAMFFPMKKHKKTAKKNLKALSKYKLTKN